MLALDDLHWADPATRELAEALLEVTDRAPLLLALAFRADQPSEGSRFRLHALEHFPHRTTELQLGPLSSAACEELLGMLVSEGLDDSARPELVARAEGNPLYLEGFCIVTGGWLERRQRTWALTVTLLSLLPPASKAAVARIDHLPTARRLLNAAVFGRLPGPFSSSSETRHVRARPVPLAGGHSSSESPRYPSSCTRQARPAPGNALRREPARAELSVVGRSSRSAKPVRRTSTRGSGPLLRADRDLPNALEYL